MSMLYILNALICYLNPLTDRSELTRLLKNEHFEGFYELLRLTYLIFESRTKITKVKKETFVSSDKMKMAQTFEILFQIKLK